ncbi:helix-turn-helix transcriptional regulator [Maribacter sp. CXY002]|uniref:helix-turn-helix transcriptional regulator n=1 Tax=Maribacter luteocoastalis TaxID=3407671 RepID=UPI003B679D6B
MKSVIKRIEEIMNFYQVTAAAFADTIGVQRSSISHLLTGRNKPSLEFVTKVIDVYKEVDLYWLLYGKGTFPAYEYTSRVKEEKDAIKATDTNVVSTKSEIERIVIFYKDQTFTTHYPNG